MMWRYSRRETKLLLIATLLLFSGYAMLLGLSWQRAVDTEAILTANTVGVLAGVEENSTNLLAMQLAERSAELDRREAGLAAASSQQGADTTTLLFVTFVGVGLLGLILLNFYLDSKRRMTFAQV